jgi:hypothetical protein
MYYKSVLFSVGALHTFIICYFIHTDVKFRFSGFILGSSYSNKTTVYTKTHVHREPSVLGLNPLKLSGNNMYQLLFQPVTPCFVFVGFV